MARVNYVKCDICGTTLDTDPRFIGFRNGVRFALGTIFNREYMDICKECLRKIHRLKIDLEIENEVVNELIDKPFEQYDNVDCQSAYLSGMEDAMKILSHKQLRYIKDK